MSVFPLRSINTGFTGDSVLGTNILGGFTQITGSAGGEVLTYDSLTDTYDFEPLPTGGGGADDGVIDDFEAVLNGNDIDFTVGRTVGDDLTESVTVGHPSRLYLAPDISYGGTNNRDVMIDQGGYVPVEGDIVIFQHNAGPAADYSTGESIRLAIGNATPVNTRIQEGPSLREVRFSDITRYNILGWYRGSNNFQLIYKTYQDAIFEIDDEGSELTTHTQSINFVGDWRHGGRERD